MKTKRMTAVEVSVHDGDIYVSQLDPQGDNDQCVILHPEQVPVVIKWLREAARDASHEGA
jgi:hypothetical protein